MLNVECSMFDVQFFPSALGGLKSQILESEVPFVLPINNSCAISSAMSSRL
jgi:hypothetical protein